MTLTTIKILGMWLLSAFVETDQHLKEADRLFSKARFAEAKMLYASVLKRDANNLKALIQVGYSALLLNQLDEAELWLRKAKEAAPRQTLINNLLADLYYRRNDFRTASFYFNIIGRKAMAGKLQSFGDQLPYEMDPGFGEAIVPFIVTDPLPFVRVKIDDRFEGNFIIDTGGGEIMLDNEFARECGIRLFGTEAASGFGGGKRGTLGHGKLTSVTLGESQVRNIPINILSLRHIELAGIKIDGIIGTVFLSQFLSTLDYKNGRLILRDKRKNTFDNLLATASNPAVVPFAMASDHFMFGHGNLNDGDTLLWFVDTGLSGSAFSCPASTLKKSNLAIQKNSKRVAEGGGGKFDIFRFDIKRICLNEVCMQNLHGEYGAFPAQLEKSFGFTVDGLLSHEFFREFSFTIDFKEMKYLIER